MRQLFNLSNRFNRPVHSSIVHPKNEFGDTWNIGPQGNNIGHFANFPDYLIIPSPSVSSLPVPILFLFPFPFTPPTTTTTSVYQSFVRPR